MVRVLVVDDSAFMRNALSNMLASDPEISVIATARDGLEAIAKVKTLKPDIVTLDIEMPRMDGIEALEHIMAENPLPVVMVSSLTTEGAAVTLRALDMGALDFIPKNLQDLSVNILNIKAVLVEKIKLLARRGVRRIPKSDPLPPEEKLIEELFIEPEDRAGGRTTGERKLSLLAMGTSTGGPKAIQEVLSVLPRILPVPVVIAQHMPPNFTGPFAERLDSLTNLKVKEAVDGEPLRPGVVYIAPGGGNMRVTRKSASETNISVSETREEYIYCPSVDALMGSCNEAYPGRTLAVILTGMGHDGLEGIREVKRGGGRVFAQDETTCVVYGMPKAIVDEGLADKVLPLNRIAGEIVNSL
jgi:two-component system chemotaxis response regulator CheB